MIKSILLIISAVVATIAAYMAYRACRCAVIKAECAIELASLAIDRVSSSRASRLNEASIARASSICDNQYKAYDCFDGKGDQ